MRGHTDALDDGLVSLYGSGLAHTLIDLIDEGDIHGASGRYALLGLLSDGSAAVGSVGAGLGARRASRRRRARSGN